MDVMDVIADDVDYYSLRPSTVGSTPNLLFWMLWMFWMIWTHQLNAKLNALDVSGCYYLK